MRLEELRLKLNAISVYRTILEDKLLKSLQLFLERIFSEKIDLNCFVSRYNSIYFDLVSMKQQVSLREYIIDLIITDENPFSWAAERTEYESINIMLVKAASNDLRNLEEISKVSSDIFKEYALQYLCTSSYEATVVNSLPDWNNGQPEGHTSTLKELFYENDIWNRYIRELSDFYKTNGTGIFSRYRAFKWEKEGEFGSLKGIDTPDPVMLSDFIGYETERSEIINNTEQFLKGYSANNMLLYGDRGTGKSSTVKALVNEYWKKGLRIVEVPKNNLADFPKIIAQLKDRKQKFIIFIDDLAFEDEEESYTSLKAVLEGGLQSRPLNVVIYATSNRRHLIKEKFSDRLGLQSGNADDEIRSQDTIQEKLSLADRFGITIVFSSPDKNRFLEIVEGIAAKRGICYDRDKLVREALKWEMWYNGRSPRTARQFIDWLEGNTSVVCR